MARSQVEVEVEVVWLCLHINTKTVKKNDLDSMDNMSDWRVRSGCQNRVPADIVFHLTRTPTRTQKFSSFIMALL